MSTDLHQQLLQMLSDMIETSQGLFLHKPGQCTLRTPSATRQRSKLLCCHVVPPQVVYNTMTKVTFTFQEQH